MDQSVHLLCVENYLLHYTIFFTYAFTSAFKFIAWDCIFMLLAVFALRSRTRLCSLASNTSRRWTRSVCGTYHRSCSCNDWRLATVSTGSTRSASTSPSRKCLMRGRPSRYRSCTSLESLPPFAVGWTKLRSWSLSRSSCLFSRSRTSKASKRWPTPLGTCSWPCVKSRTIRSTTARWSSAWTLPTSAGRSASWRDSCAHSWPAVLFRWNHWPSFCIC